LKEKQEDQGECDMAKFRLKGLKHPHQGVSLMMPIDKNNTDLNTPEGLEGYHFDGSFHLLPLKEAETLMSAAVTLAQSVRTRNTCVSG
jgi:hypothetical protein